MKKSQRPTKQYYDVSEIEIILGLSRDTIYKLIRTGQLKARRFRKNGKWYVENTDFKKFEQNMIGN